MFDISIFVERPDNIIDLKRGEFLFSESEPVDCIFIVVSGMLHVLKGNGIAFANEGAVFGEYALLAGMNIQYSVLALTDAQVATVSKAGIFQRGTRHLFATIMTRLALKIKNPNYEEFSFQIMGTQAAMNPIQSSPVNEYAGMPGGMPVSAPLSNSPIAQATPQIATTPTIVVPGKQNKAFNAEVFPQGHGYYSLAQKPINRALIIPKKMVCPACKSKFTSNYPYISKLAMDHMDRDMRKHFKDFEILWVNTITCQECLYSNFYREFPSVTQFALKRLQESLKSIKGKVSYILPEGEIIDLNQVFTSYFLTQYTLKTINPDLYAAARINLHLSWLYRDVQDQEMSDKFSQLALQSYNKAYYESDKGLAPKQTQEVCMIIAELSAKHGYVDAARRAYYEVIENNRKSEMANIARDRIVELKESKKNE